MVPGKIIIGRIGAPYGLKGWLKLQSFTQPESNICSYTKGWLQYPKKQDWQSYIAVIKPSGKAFLIKFDHCDDPETARQFTGITLAVERTQLPQLDEGDYYWSDLEGLRVITESGVVLGHLAYFIPTGGSDVMVVQDAEKNRLIPYIDDVVIRVDIANQELIVRWDPLF